MPPAARVGDTTAHGTPLVGPGCPTVLIGNMPAWRGLDPTAGAAIGSAGSAAAASVNAAAASATAAAGTPGAPAAIAALSAAVAAATAQMSAMFAAAACDQTNCPMVVPAPAPAPHGPGIVITASTTVKIGGQAAARMGDTLQEALAPSSVAAGCMTVIIGG